MTATSTEVMTTLDQRVVDAATGTLELFGVYLGDRLGLYDALRDGRAGTARRAGRGGRHRARATPGSGSSSRPSPACSTVDDAAAAPTPGATRCRTRTSGSLADPSRSTTSRRSRGWSSASPAVLDEVVDAYRSGGGVPYARYGADFRSGQGAINRPAFTTALVEEWLPALGRPVERLARRRPPRRPRLRARAGRRSRSRRPSRRPRCGASTPTRRRSRTPGRRRGARRDGARSSAADAAELAGHGPFDVVLLLEALHDLARPVEVLAAARAALAAGGVVLVADEAVAPAFTAPGDDIERMMYGWSITPLPAGVDGRAAVGRHRHGDPRGHRARAGRPRPASRQVEVLDVDGGLLPPLRPAALSPRRPRQSATRDLGPVAAPGAGADRVAAGGGRASGCTSATCRSAARIR